MIKETNIPNLTRISQGVFVNTDQNELELYLKKRDAEYAKQAEVAGLKNQLNNMSNEISELKKLIQGIVNG
jgi:hypothetical protein